MELYGEANARVGLVAVDEAVFLLNNKQTLTRKSVGFNIPAQSVIFKYRHFHLQKCLLFLNQGVNSHKLRNKAYFISMPPIIMYVSS